MWISKRKWNNMDEKVDKLAVFVERLIDENTRLCIRVSDLKDEIPNFDEIIRNNANKYWELRNSIAMLRNAPTKKISDVTLEELARLVIDGTSIIREETSKVKKEYGMKENNIVQTDN